MKPLVSVIIPVYNGERYLAQAIESVLAQTYPAFEVIVVDDGSTDGTAQVAAGFADRVHYVYQTNQGPSAARDAGLHIAGGDLIGFLDADDLWTPNKLSVQVDYMLDHPEVAYTIARVKFFLEPGCAIPRGFRRELLEGDHIARVMETLVARNSVFDVVRLLNPEFQRSEDVDWFLRASDLKIPMAIVPQVLLYKRVHDTNLSLSVGSEHLLRALRRSIQRKRNREEQNE